MTGGVEEQIDQWRGFVRRRQVIAASDVEEMEDHLREQIADLEAGGLDGEEAFLVAVKRMGNLDAVSREFAREHSHRLWKQLVLVPEADAGGAGRWRELGVMIGFALAAGVAVKLLFSLVDDETALIRNLAFVVLPFLAGWFAWKRRVSWRVCAVTAAVAAVPLLAVDLYPFATTGGAYPSPGMTDVLAFTHAPILLWLLVGVLHAGGHWRSHERRMDYVRFTGEFVMYLVLIQLGSMVLLGLTAAVLSLVGVDFEPFLEDWLLPFGLPGVLLVAAWLVEAKKSVVENIAPVLTRVFTPLALVMLVADLVVLLVNGPLTTVDRELLILMDAVLVLVLFLLLYSISARDPLAPPGVFDWLQLALVGAALAVNAVALTAMLTRIAEFGSTANKTAALGLNLVLLVHLVWSAWLLAGFVRGRRPFAQVERWQTAYLPVYAAWTAVVVLLFPPVFGFA
ncbi:permease prefix domain 1-containing protein [Nocardiopsis lambiniae]|uniref:Permease prefix domain 1-containing protein n=1 Tax=Nocardiopsis lambiniae TaxID=3075539 RepID=A0ABU2M445_9ACTN|nr:permease prefix domain 1-containing protein [Nocardiopsis sp. DSM 44743]MDT0327372.1 permease prefix domain 1-containing protein [Nocardiopsis sp. DSM 44743]